MAGYPDLFEVDLSCRPRATSLVERFTLTVHVLDGRLRFVRLREDNAPWIKALDRSGAEKRERDALETIARLTGWTLVGKEVDSNGHLAVHFHNPHPPSYATDTESAWLDPLTGLVLLAGNPTFPGTPDETIPHKP